MRTVDGVDISSVLGKLSEDPEMMKRAAELAQSLMGDRDKDAGPETGAAEDKSGGDDEVRRTLPALPKKGTDTVNLLKAIRPYLNETRQGKIDSIIKLMRVMDLGKLVRF